MLPDYEGCFNLLAAIVRQWAVDSHNDPAERFVLAAWLGLEPRQLEALLAPPGAPPAAPPGWPACPVYGRAIRPAQRGRQGRFCSATCRERQRRAVKSGREYSCSDGAQDAPGPGVTKTEVPKVPILKGMMNDETV